MRLDAYSHSRFNAGVRAKRAYGSATATIFLVWDKDAPKEARGLYVIAYGPTPGERKTNAMRAAEPYFTGRLPIPVENSELRAVRTHPAV